MPDRTSLVCPLLRQLRADNSGCCRRSRPVISESVPSHYHVSGQVKTISWPRGQKGRRRKRKRRTGMNRLDRVWSWRGRWGWWSVQCVFVKGAPCESCSLLEETTELTIIRSLGDKWFGILERWASSPPVSSTFNMNYTSLSYAAAPPPQRPSHTAGAQ